MNLLRLTAVLILFALTATTADARMIDVIGWYGWADLTGDPRLENTDPGDFDDIDIDFDSETGFGVGVNLFIGERFSLQGSVYRFENDAAATAPGLAPFTLGTLEVIPVNAVLQFHLLPNSAIDPYVGIGVGYVLLDDIETREDLEEIDFDRVALEDDYGLVYNAGVSIGFTAFLSVNLDAKYIPVDSAATAVFLQGPGQQTEIELNPLILSAGLSLQF